MDILMHKKHITVVVVEVELVKGTLYTVGMFNLLFCM